MENKLNVVRVKLVEDMPLYCDGYIDSPEDAFNLMKKEIASYDREILCVVNLTSKGQPINMSIVSMGDVKSSIAAPREIFKASILSNAAAIIVLHNHPSGDPTPSPADLSVTKRLISCGELLDIPLEDHIIVGAGGGYFSFVNHDIMGHLKKDAENIFFKEEKRGYCDTSEREKSRTKKVNSFGEEKHRAKRR